MTTRSLIVVIVVLAVIDLVAGLWYLDGRLTDNGQSPFSFGFSDSAVEEASTVPEAVGRDEFKMAGGNAYYVTDKPVSVDDMSAKLSSTMRIAVKWPQKINGDNEPQALTEALLGKMFAADYGDLPTAIKTELSKPVFSTGTGHKCSKVNKAPVVTERFSHVQSVKAYPVMNSSRVLVYEIEKKTFGGNAGGLTDDTRFVVYDRMKGKVLALADMVASGCEERVLSIINKKIDKINGKDARYDHARTLPDNVRVKHKGLLFYFQKGELGDTETEIYVDFESLGKMLTPAFAAMSKSNGDFVDFDPIKFQ